jgi:hypothetical protein
LQHGADHFEPRARRLLNQLFNPLTQITFHRNDLKNVQPLRAPPVQERWKNWPTRYAF